VPGEGCAELVKGLRVDEEPRAATYLRAYAPTTMAPRGGMVYDVRQGAFDRAYVRQGLHYEFFHFIDYGPDRAAKTMPTGCP
jgi:hypothetical protein